MAILKDTSDKEFRGHIEKTIVVKQYSDGRTIAAAFPDMSKVIPTERQKQNRLTFKEVQAYAVRYLADNPEQKAVFKEMCKPGQRPHNLLVAQLLRKEQQNETTQPGPVIAFGRTR